jgi:hypothetical protein
MANERHGIAACVYLGSPVAKLATASGYAIGITGEECEVVRFEDTWKELLRGVLSAAGSITAYHDQDAKTLQDAAQSATETPVVIYPDCTDISTYYAGVAWFDVEATGDVGSCQTLTAPFRIDGTLSKVGFAP